MSKVGVEVREKAGEKWGLSGQAGFTNVLHFDESHGFGGLFDSFGDLALVGSIGGESADVDMSDGEEDLSVELEEIGIELTGGGFDFLFAKESELILAGSGGALGAVVGGEHGHGDLACDGGIGGGGSGFFEGGGDDDDVGFVIDADFFIKVVFTDDGQALIGEDFEPGDLQTVHGGEFPQVAIGGEGEGDVFIIVIPFGDFEKAFGGA